MWLLSGGHPLLFIVVFCFPRKGVIFMPKTKFQSIIFTALMVFCMVFCMTVYTISLNSGVFDFQTFSLAIREMWLEYIVVFCLIFFLITNTSKKLAFRISNQIAYRPFLQSCPFNVLPYVRSFRLLLFLRLSYIMESHRIGFFNG